MVFEKCVCVCACVRVFEGEMLYAPQVIMYPCVGLYWTYRLKPQPHRHWPSVAPAEPPLSITSRGRPQLFSFSTFSVFSLFVTGNRCCWSPRLPALLLLFSESFHNCCGETADRNHFCSVPNINFTRVSGSGVVPSMSPSFFLSSVQRWHQKNTCSASSGTPYPAGHCGVSSCLNW